MNDIIHLSRIDQERFGIIVAKTNKISLNNIKTIHQFCIDNKVELLIARCKVDDLQTVQEMERTGYILTDTLVYYKRDVLKKPITINDNNEYNIRLLNKGEEKNVLKISRNIFKKYYGHYHADSKLDNDKCDEVYSSWSYRACFNKEVADDVLIAELNGEIVGFATLKLINNEEGEGVLFGVLKKAQGKGIYRSFINTGMEWCLNKGKKRMVVSTQINNIAVQKVWTRLGFEPDHAFYTFHKWYK